MILMYFIGISVFLLEDTKAMLETCGFCLL